MMWLDEYIMEIEAEITNKNYNKAIKKTKSLIKTIKEISRRNKKWK